MNNNQRLESLVLGVLILYPGSCVLDSTIAAEILFPVGRNRPNLQDIQNALDRLRRKNLVEQCDNAGEWQIAQHIFSQIFIPFAHAVNVLVGVALGAYNAEDYINACGPAAQNLHNLI